VCTNDGTLRWQAALPGATTPAWSPVDERFLVDVPCEQGGTRLLSIDAATSETAEILGCGHPEAARWIPSGAGLLLSTPCESIDERLTPLRLEWLDPSTGRRLSITDCGVVRPNAWSPDGSRLAVLEACGEERWRVRFFDDEGRALGRGPCDRYELAEWSPASDMVSLGVRPSTDGAPSRVHVLRLDGELLDLGPGRPGHWRPISE
jgi:hypothetical protein